MAWVVPDTYVVGQLLTAGSMNKISGDLHVDRGASLPVSPVDGQWYSYVVDDTNGIEWSLIFDSSQAKWRFVGGNSLAVYALTSNTSNNGTWVDTATSSVLTVPRAGNYLISINGGALAGNAGAGGTQSFSSSWGVSINAAATPTLTAGVSFSNATGGFEQVAGPAVGRWVSTLNASDTIRAKWEMSGPFTAIAQTLNSLEIVPIFVS